MAFSTLDGIASHPKVKLVCAAEVDSGRLDRFKRKYPDARLYQDWREMLRKERGQIDAACVGTPDHMHAPQAISSMHAGLPVYVQKPLAHDIHEVRTLMKMARAKKLPTQMGMPFGFFGRRLRVMFSKCRYLPWKVTWSSVHRRRMTSIYSRKRGTRDLRSTPNAFPAISIAG